MNELWIAGSFIAGSLITLFAKSTTYKDLNEKNKAVEKENYELKMALNEVTKNIENKAREIAVFALTHIAKEIEEQKETK